MTNPKHTDTSRSGDMVKMLRAGDLCGLTLAADRIEALEAEVERLTHGWEAQHGEKVKVREEARLWFEKAKTLKAENERLREAMGDIKEAWDWWNVDTHDRCASVVDDAIRAALEKKQ